MFHCLGHCRLLVLTWLTILGSVACTERVPTTPTGPGQSTTPSTQPPASCTYEISPTSRIHGPGTENGTLSVTAPSGCAWTATSGVSWITVTSGGSGTGNGALGYAVAANSGAGRTGTMTVAGLTFAVEQATPACRLDDIADVSRWRVLSSTRGSVRVSGQQVELRAAGAGQNQVGVVSVCALQGDFDVQVDYSLINWPINVGYAIALNVASSATRTLGVHRNGSGANSFYTLLLRGGTPVGQIATNDTRGRLRMVRTSGSVAGYYSSESGWRNLGATDFGIEPLRIQLDLGSPGTAPAPSSELIITFENFRINSGTPAN